ncbi:hypothetical protein J2W37_002216 [Variovorax paradoxus]|uniref:DUF599 family protein n=1 Tax=Variovorax paradoxus TaxID=34073 RepID=UPI001AE6FBBE|nr:DUF599 family protein [Variovorax paradoxus]MDP9964496.1 hypothetical protein [Variovorax paradoxus]
MSATAAWLAILATAAVLVAYEGARAWAQHRAPHRLARSAHALLREDWFDAVSRHQGSEILSVQMLRNSLMSATMTASTAALGLVGTATLAAPSLREGLGASGWLHLTPRLVSELLLLALLLASLVCSAMAVRYYTHLGFISGMPVECAARQRWNPTGHAYVRRAGSLYGWGLRHLILVAPVLAALLHPLAGPLAALAVTAALWGFDRVDGE